MRSKKSNDSDDGDKSGRNDECKKVVRRVAFDGQKVGYVRVGVFAT